MEYEEIWSMTLATIFIVTALVLGIYLVIKMSNLEKQRMELNNKKTKLEIQKLEKELKE